MERKARQGEEGEGRRGRERWERREGGNWEGERRKGAFPLFLFYETTTDAISGIRHCREKKAILVIRELIMIRE